MEIPENPEISSRYVVLSAVTLVLLLSIMLFSGYLGADLNPDKEISGDNGMEKIDNEYEVNLPEGQGSIDDTLIKDGSQRYHFSEAGSSGSSYDCSTEDAGCIEADIDRTYRECEDVYHATHEEMKDHCILADDSDSVTLRADERLNDITAPITDEKYEVETHYENFGEGHEFVNTWDIEKITQDRYLITGLNGHIYDIKDGEVTTYKIDVLETGPNDKQEDNYVGLMGAVKHPDFQENRQIYLHYSYNTSEFKYEEGTLNRVSRFELNRENGKIEKIDTVIDGLPGRQYYHGGRMRFDDKGEYLYITTGAAVYEYAEDPEFLGGKILRIKPDGTIPESNPYNNSVYARGFRNPQGLDFHPETDDLITAQHGPYRRDNIARINKTTNMGWPDHCKRSHPEAEFGETYLCTQTYTLAPSGITFVDDEDHPWYNSLFIASLRGSQVHRIEFNHTKAVRNEIFWFNGYKAESYPDYGNRIRDVEFINDKLYVLHDKGFLTKISPDTDV